MSFLRAQRKGSNGLLTLIGATLSAILLAQMALAEEVIDGSLAAAEEASDEPLVVAEKKSDGIFEVITVTAQNREESIQSVPIAISAYDENFIRLTKLDDVKDLIDFTPGFAGKSKDSFIDTISVRGIVTNDFGVGGDPSIGIFKDGVHQGRTGAAITSFFDMKRVEALRGPQGFLFGRNAVSGAISTIVNKPDPDSFDTLFHVGIGQRDHVELEAMANAPLGQGWALRVAGYYFAEDGYVDNKFAPDAANLIRTEKMAGRLSLGYQGEALSLDLISEFENRDQSGTIYRAIRGDESLEFFGVTLRGNGRDADSDLLNDRDDGEIFSFTGLIDYDLGWATASSITGVRVHDYRYAEDFDGSPLRINHYFQDQDGEYFSQEFRLVSAADGPITWFVGISGYGEDIDASFLNQGDEEIFCEAWEESSCSDAFPGFTNNPNGLIETNDVRGRNLGFGTYLDATYAFLDQFELNAGIRYTFDEKDFAMRINEVDSDLGPYYMFGYTTVGFVREKEQWDEITPRFTFRYFPTEDWTLWSSVTKGYKSGGFGSFSLDLPTPEQLGFTPQEIQDCEDEELGIFCVVNDDGTVPAMTTPSKFDPETVWSYEIGAKATLADGRVHFDINGYYYDYRDLQITYFDEELLNTLVENVGQVDAFGVEATMRARPDDHWDLMLTWAWSKTDISKVPDAICENCDGNRLTHNPEWTVSGLAIYRFPLGPGEIAVGGEFHYQSSVHGGLNNLEFTKIDGYIDASFRVAYESEFGWEIAAYVENAFNKLYYDGSYDAEFPLPAVRFGASRPLLSDN